MSSGSRGAILNLDWFLNYRDIKLVGEVSEIERNHNIFNNFVYWGYFSSCLASTMKLFQTVGKSSLKHLKWMYALIENEAYFWSSALWFLISLLSVPEACLPCLQLFSCLSRPSWKVSRPLGKVSRLSGKVSRTSGKVSRVSGKVSTVSGKVGETSSRNFFSETSSAKLLQRNFFSETS